MVAPSGEGAVRCMQMALKTSRNKFIPSEFYLAPDEFIIGLLDGYFSGDGHITKNSIELSSASYELITKSRFHVSNLNCLLLDLLPEPYPRPDLFRDRE